MNLQPLPRQWNNSSMPIVVSNENGKFANDMDDYLLSPQTTRIIRSYQYNTATVIFSHNSITLATKPMELERRRQEEQAAAAATSVTASSLTYSWKDTQQQNTADRTMTSSTCNDDELFIY
jgi:hypothetical protein